MLHKEELIRTVRLPTLSKSLYEIVELEEKNPTSFFADIKKIIERDPLLSTHILKVANSPYYGFPQKVRTISHSISLLGIQKIKNIAFAYSVFDFFKKVNYRSEFGGVFNLFLKKSLLISSISTLLAKKKNLLEGDELILSGLLTEIGQVLLFLHSPEKYAGIYSIHDRKLIPAEIEVFGIDHIDAAIAMAQSWSLPEYLHVAIANHHELKSENDYCQVLFMATRIAEWLLTEGEQEKQEHWNELAESIEAVLHLTPGDIEETLRALPEVIDNLIRDFPEVQSDLKRVIDTSSALILSLMKREMDMVMLTQELTDTQARLTKEKNLLAHLLNLSFFFSSLLPPLKIISALFDYFAKFIQEFDLAFVYRAPGQSAYHLITPVNPDPRVEIDPGAFESLRKVTLTGEMVMMHPEEIRKLGGDPAIPCLAFPITFHHTLFGFVLLKTQSNHRFSDIEVSYIRILANIIANSFQNYFSFESLKRETAKKEMLTRELSHSDDELAKSLELLTGFQKSEVAGEILPVVFHKLKNKLTPILGYAQILIARTTDEAVRHRLSEIERNASELTNLLNVLREYFRVERKPRYKHQLNSIITRMLGRMEEVLAQEGIRISLDLDPAIRDSLLNPGQIEALLQNLIDNARFALRQKGTAEKTITVTTRHEGDQCRLLLRDSGIGISEDELSKIWNPFFHKFEGRAGLGLSICEQIIAQHNGKYALHSQVGEFTEIDIAFHYEEEQAQGEPPLPAPVPMAARAHVLIVDDEEYLLDLLRDILLATGSLAVTIRSSFAEALETLNRMAFDLVICDVPLPGCDEREAIDQLLQKISLDRLLITLSEPYSESAIRMLQERGLTYFKKPFELMKLKRRVLERLH